MCSEEKSITLYEHLTQSASVNGRTIRVWDRAFVQAFAESKSVFVPENDEPYYISETIVLESGTTLRLDASAEIRAVPGMITALLRNKTILPGNQYAEPESIQPDSDISVSGGIWSASVNENPKYLGCYDLERSVTGMNGTFVFSNVNGLKICDLEIRDTTCFCIQLGNAENVEAAGLTFRNSRGDGLHMNGPLKNVHAHDLINEGTGDDFIALNAWDWVHSHITAGNIENVVVENCNCRSGYNCIRLLAGEKKYFDGSVRECKIKNILIQNIRNVQNFKLYPQAYCGMQQHVKTGKMENITFRKIYGLKKMNSIPFDPPYYGQKDRSAPFEILADLNELILEDLYGDFDFDKKTVVAAVGPLAGTGGVKTGDDPFFAREIFPAHLSGTVKKLQIGPVFDAQGNPAAAPEKLVQTFKLSPRPAFVPGQDLTRGGTGEGIVAEIIGKTPDPNQN